VPDDKFPEITREIHLKLEQEKNDFQKLDELESEEYELSASASSQKKKNSINCIEGLNGKSQKYREEINFDHVKILEYQLKEDTDSTT